MSAKAVSELSGKELLYRHLECCSLIDAPTAIRLSAGDDFDAIVMDSTWLNETQKAVIKPDQLIKRRGKHGLVKCGTVNEIKKWFIEKSNTYVQVGKTNGRLHTFIVEPFCAHNDADELYIAIYSQRYNDVIMFYEHGGVDVGDIDEKARTIRVEVSLDENGMMPTEKELDELIGNLGDKTTILKTFILALYTAYKSLHFTYLEINPLVVQNGNVYILDLAAKLDETANFLCSDKWKTRTGSDVEFPAPFGRELTKEEQYIADLDAKTGASLKLTILNRRGRIWTMVAGGGASVVFTDTVCDLGGASELANYGEYSGDPSETQTFEYAKTLLSVMTEGPPNPQGKVLIIGGSIANFTNVAKTFGVSFLDSFFFCYLILALIEEEIRFHKIDLENYRVSIIMILIENNFNAWTVSIHSNSCAQCWYVFCVVTVSYVFYLILRQIYLVDVGEKYSCPFLCHMS
uniref:ATP citrate synthase n=1 Tax=Angiostrongylus cantonensis TaxID=6313 RepID=A0A0K0DPA5_ANGCA